jgi:hypothetical protein
VDPRVLVGQLRSQADHHLVQARRALSGGAGSGAGPLIGDLLVTELVPYGYKGTVRKAGRFLGGRSQDALNRQWLQTGHSLLQQCRGTLGSISVLSGKLPPGGNSSKLLQKLNKLHRMTRAVTFLATLSGILAEIEAMPLISNQNITAELARRAEEGARERSARAALRASSPEVVRLAKTVDVFNRIAIAEQLRGFPEVAQPVLGALDSVARQGPDGNRHCITSCRASIEALAIRLGGVGDWKVALKRVLPSDTDQRVVVGAWNYLSGKGAHGGHAPSREEAEHGLRITIATLEYMIGKAAKRPA